MTWIKTIPFKDADNVLRRALRSQRKNFPVEYSDPVAGLGDESVVATHTLIPLALKHAFSTLAALLSADLPLSRAQHEMIATVVSSRNRCHF